MQVAEIIQDKSDRVVATAPDTRIESVTKVLEAEGVGAVLVRAEEGTTLGILSERDIVHGVARHGPEAVNMLASDLMTSSVIDCRPEDDIEALMHKMLESRIRHLPVVENGALIGIISIGDVVNAVVGEFKWMRATLQDQLMKSTVWSTEEDPD